MISPSKKSQTYKMNLMQWKMSFKKPKRKKTIFYLNKETSINSKKIFIKELKKISMKCSSVRRKSSSIGLVRTIFLNKGSFSGEVSSEINLIYSRLMVKGSKMCFPSVLIDLKARVKPKSESYLKLVRSSLFKKNDLHIF